ncbi:MAG TPA: PAS domain-containing protein [Steroidobacteraceae bacterium]|nr:PAS domain-containing protein [Steroidobacteraceae bacterium]
MTGHPPHGGQRGKGGEVQDILGSPWLRDIAVNLVVSAIVFAVGFAIGKYRQRALMRGRNLEQYDFYPFEVDADGFPHFSLTLFQRGVERLLEAPDATAAAQLIVLGEQNGVRYQLDPRALARYEALYAKYDGGRVLEDSSEYLENYRRIVRLLGGTFRGMGIEILLHDLVNPSRSITAIAGGEVTGRSEGMGTTSLVIDLKRRRVLAQDKLNYGLAIGARNFKCTTVPIVREPYGIVGAVCMNIDVNYIRDHVLATPEATRDFFRKYCAIDMQLDENILSRPEYEKAVAGKRHWQDQ